MDAVLLVSFIFAFYPKKMRWGAEVANEGRMLLSVFAGVSMDKKPKWMWKMINVLRKFYI